MILLLLLLSFSLAELHALLAKPVCSLFTQPNYSSKLFQIIDPHQSEPLAVSIIVEEFVQSLLSCAKACTVLNVMVVHADACHAKISCFGPHIHHIHCLMILLHQIALIHHVRMFIVVCVCCCVLIQKIYNNSHMCMY